METSSRRTFLVASLGTLGVAGLGAVLYPLLRYLAPSKSAGTKQIVTLKLSEIPEGGAKFFELNGSAGVLVKLKGGNVAAFSAVCTHLGCIIP
jgi:cytochrome b6-f complex iron-sulfur subunit